MPDGKTFGLSTIGQIAVHVQDLDRAVAFYRERLGMHFLFQAPYFKVDDIHGATAALKDRGVTMADEPHVIAKMDTYDLWMAFFRDSEGNMHGLMREVPQ